jgi:hypothetical protein
MTFDDMINQYASYVSDENLQAQYVQALDHMFQAAGEDCATGFHERTIARLAATIDPATPDVLVDLSSDSSIQ